MITKELLSEVLGFEAEHIVTDLKEIHDNINRSAKENNIAVCYNRKWDFINIYELAHKCKLWASMIDTNNMFVNHISSHTTKEQTTQCVIGFYCIKNNILEDDETKVFTANSEQEAIFNACQWVLDNK